MTDTFKFINDITYGDIEIPDSKITLRKINNSPTSDSDDIANSVKKQIKSKKLTLDDRLHLITSEVTRVLGKYTAQTLVIYTKEDLHNYISKSIENNIISIDTETNNSIDPITCKLMGLCLYTTGEKNVYVPINHRNPQTKEKLSCQLTEQDVHDELQRVVDSKIFTVFQNGKFDYQVLKCTCNVALQISWDTLIATKVLNENEKAGLKFQYSDKIDNSQEEYDIEELFKDVEYADVSPDIFALYSATDAYMTLKLYEYQLFILNHPEFSKLKKLLEVVEIPCVEVVANMELEGIEVDQEYAKRLSIKYHAKLDELQVGIDEELSRLEPLIAKWRLTKEANAKSTKDNSDKAKSKSEQLKSPVNLDSPTQLAILLYDVLGAEVIDKKTPRGTGSDILKQMDLNICKLIVKRKEVLKLTKDFIDSLPQKVNIDNRIHCSFNQYGADTGRFSSSNPNLQQIPSHAKDIRMIFKAKDGYTLVGGDFSAQEPRLTAFTSGDESMLNAYYEGKDLYSVIASLSFNMPYEDCLEFYPEGTKITIDGKEIICGHKTNQNKAGKERRTQAKSILLGLLYGRGAKSIGEQIHKSKEEAQDLIDRFFKAFPTVKKWIDRVHVNAKKTGYVEDWFGRRRRLPDILLPEYLIEPIKANDELSNFNPFLECSDRVDVELNKKIKKYREELAKTTWKSKIDDITKDARSNGILVRSNSILISQAERQSVNAVIQGGAATLTKLAMNNIYHDEILNKYKFKMLVTIHDEVLGECPSEYADEVAKRLSEVMINTAKPYMSVPMSVDCYEVSHWYEDEYSEAVIVEYKKLRSDSGLSVEDAFNTVVSNHSEITKEKLHDIIFNV